MRLARFHVLMAIIVCAVACSPSEEAGQGSGAQSASPPPIGTLNTPVEGAEVTVGTFVSGWALDDSGIAAVSVTFDDGQVAYVRRGDDFPGVKQRFPNYPDADKAAYMFAIPKMKPGAHSLTVVVRARDGGTVEIKRRFVVR